MCLHPQGLCLDSGFEARSLCSAGSVCFACLFSGAPRAPAPCMPPAGRTPKPPDPALVLASCSLGDLWFFSSCFRHEP